jgi:hypothetical protein
MALYPEFRDSPSIRASVPPFPAQFQKSFTIRADLSTTYQTISKIAFARVRFALETAFYQLGGRLDAET